MSEVFIASIVLLAINIILIFFPKVSFLNFAVGAITMLISVQYFKSDLLPFSPYFALLLFLAALMSFISAVISLRED